MTAENEDAAGTVGPAPSASTPASTHGRFATLYTAELAERILNEVQGGRPCSACAATKTFRPTTPCTAH
jgi:hypothetical protein